MVWVWAIMSTTANRIITIPVRDGMNPVNFIFPEDGITVTFIRNQSEPKLSSVETAQLATEYLFFKEN